MLSKNDFWPRREEWRFKNKPASRILIQVSSISDSIVAHFRESNAHKPTFSTASAQTGTTLRCRKMSAVGAIPEVACEHPIRSFPDAPTSR
jgi:hypothetical protein